jgi:hypothetical protein
MPGDIPRNPFHFILTEIAENGYTGRPQSEQVQNGHE